MAYGDFENLTRRTASDNILCHKAFDIAKNLKYDGYQRGLASMVYRYFNKKASGGAIKNENMSNKELTEELRLLGNYEKILKKKIMLIFYVWSANLAYMQLISKFNKGIFFLLCVINIFSKYAWVIPLKGKKDITIINDFKKILKESNRKPNKIWVDKDSECYIKPMKLWLEKEMYSTHNKGKSVVAERFLRTLKNKIYKYMTSISKNVCIDKLDDIVNKYNNTYHSTIKMKPVYVKPNTYIDFNK